MGAFDPRPSWLPARHRLTVEQYHRMGEAGILGPDERVELIEGEVVQIAPIGTRHAAAVMRLNRLLSVVIGEAAIVSVQNPVCLDDGSEPQPDITLLRPRADFYAGAHPRPADVLLVIEVADSSARYDRDIKLPLYAAAGVPEVWLVDLEARLLRCHQQPVGGEYRLSEIIEQPGLQAPVALPQLRLDLTGLLD
jgi:Uma2 family endonuclease